MWIPPDGGRSSYYPFGLFRLIRCLKFIFVKRGKIFSSYGTIYIFAALYKSRGIYRDYHARIDNS